MKLEKIESSQMRRAGFNPETHQMVIEFSTGAIYRYDNVEQETFDAFLAAESKGKFFGSVIKPQKDKYPYTKIQDSDHVRGVERTTNQEKLL